MRRAEEEAGIARLHNKSSWALNSKALKQREDIKTEVSSHSTFLWSELGWGVYHPESFDQIDWCRVSLTLLRLGVIRSFNIGSPLGERGWLSRLSLWLRLGSWSCHSWVWASRLALCWQLRAWRLFQILCLPLSALPPFMLCLSLSQK